MLFELARLEQLFLEPNAQRDVPVVDHQGSDSRIAEHVLGRSFQHEGPTIGGLEAEAGGCHLAFATDDGFDEPRLFVALGRVNQLGVVTPDQRVSRRANDAFRRWAEIPHDARDIREEDEIGAVLDQGAEAFFTLAQGLLRAAQLTVLAIEHFMRRLQLRHGNPQCSHLLVGAPRARDHTFGARELNVKKRASLEDLQADHRSRLVEQTRQAAESARHGKIQLGADLVALTDL